MSARNRELLALIPAVAAADRRASPRSSSSARTSLLGNVSLTYGAIFLGLCLAAHLVLRFTLPDADPYLFPLVALLACFGLVMIYRIDDDLAREQAQWFVIGLVAVRGDDRRPARLPRARALPLHDRARRASRCCCCRASRSSASRSTARTWAIQRRAALVPAGRVRQDRDRHLPGQLPARHAPAAGASARGAFIGVTVPPLKHFGPLLVVWGAAMLMLFVIRDIGSSLMFFGGFLALLYVATNRLSFVVIGLRAVRRRARGSLYHVGHDPGPRRRLAHPFDPALYDAGRRQLPDRAVAVRPGRRRRVRPGLRPGAARAAGGPDGRAARCCPPPHTDLIYAVIINELGLRRRRRAAAASTC